MYFFLFQAEDGIRELVRSRGLGDVYKRQDPMGRRLGGEHRHRDDDAAAQPGHLGVTLHHLDAVSYTHLTLPTSDLV